MKSCPECSGKVPETYEECPFCGYHFDMLSGEGISEPSGDPAFPEKSEAPAEEESGGGLRKLFFEITLFIAALLVAGIIVLATDFKGARTELRRMCMMDSGSGSEKDSQPLRVQVKHYILVCLNLFDHGGTGASVRTNPNAFDKRIVPGEDNGTKPVELPDQKLPPSPPEVEELNFSAETPAENGTSEKPPEKKGQNAP